MAFFSVFVLRGSTTPCSLSVFTLSVTCYSGEKAAVSGACYVVYRWTIGASKLQANLDGTTFMNNPSSSIIVTSLCWDSSKAHQAVYSNLVLPCMKITAEGSTKAEQTMVKNKQKATFTSQSFFVIFTCPINCTAKIIWHSGLMGSTLLNYTGIPMHSGVSNTSSALDHFVPKFHCFFYWLSFCRRYTLRRVIFVNQVRDPAPIMHLRVHSPIIETLR